MILRGGMDKRIRWSKEEIEFIKNNFLKIEDRNMAKYLNNKTPVAVQVKRIRLGLKKPIRITLLPFEDRPFCGCGCGKRTSGRWDSRIKGYVKFLPYHHMRLERNKERVRQMAKKLNKDKKFTEEHKIKIGESGSKTRKRLFKEGKLKVWNKGIPRTEKFKKENSKLSKELWKDPEYRKKWEEGMKGTMFKFPSSLEIAFMNFLKKHNISYKYVGNGYTFIGGKCPDFIDFKNRKIIEIFGNYYHSKDDEDKRINHFSKYNYKVLILWEDEISNENLILEKVKNF